MTESNIRMTESDIYDYFEEGWPKVLGVPDSWLPAIYNLHEFIKMYVELGLVENYKIQQVKVKFGGVRFYYSLDETITNGSHQNITTIIRGAVAYTEFVCERTP